MHECKCSCPGKITIFDDKLLDHNGLMCTICKTQLFCEECHTILNSPKKLILSTYSIPIPRTHR